ncbi:hypothetical protein [Xanthomonas sp. BRIP62411]|uniref:hypothetical protein n=1 Tax=Xanthomonas sp. BRIP62411 TaxID=2182389 RepID=UPI000F8F2FCD|nr:hypothetical protein [Xanthomonas sp. BRIP62411]
MTSLTALRLGERERCLEDDLLALLRWLALLSPASTPSAWSGLLTRCEVLPAGGCWAGELSVYVNLPDWTRSTEPQIPMDEHLIGKGRSIMCGNILFEKWKREAIDLRANRGYQHRLQHAMREQWHISLLIVGLDRARLGGSDALVIVLARPSRLPAERYMDSVGSDAGAAPCGWPACSHPANHDL